jgi:UDP-glucose:(heptosyl)LPS alpha-1,3-glucosyltransferase
MLSVAIIIERMFPALGGAERSISELAEELAAQGINVRILAAAGQASQYCSVLCTDDPRKRTSFHTFEKALRQHLSQNHYDIIHSVLPFDFADLYQPRGGSYKEAMLQNIAGFSCPCLRCWKRMTHFVNIRRTTLLRAEKRLCIKNDRIVIAALSDYVKQQFIRHYHLPEERIAVIGNGVNINRVANVQWANAFRQDILKRLPLSLRNNAVLFLFAANNFRLKGLGELIAAFAEAVGKSPSTPAALVVIGKDNPDAYRQQARAMGIESRVFFCGPQEDGFSVLSACDVAVLPTYYDPCSRFILEAIAQAKPVITSRFNGAAEQFQTGRHGIVIDRPTDTSALAEAVLAMCNPKTTKTMTDAILADNLKEKVSIARHVGQLRQVYDIILAQKKGTAG